MSKHKKWAAGLATALLVLVSVLSCALADDVNEVVEVVVNEIVQTPIAEPAAEPAEPAEPTEQAGGTEPVPVNHQADDPGTPGTEEVDPVNDEAPPVPIIEPTTTEDTGELNPDQPHEPNPDQPNEPVETELGEPFEDEVPLYTVCFVIGDLSSELKVKAGEPVNAPSTTPEKEGWQFEYWYAVGTPEQTEFCFGQPTDRDLVLHALFTPIPVSVNPEPPLPIEPTAPDAVGDEPQNELPQLAPERRIAITSNVNGAVRYGDQITLTAQFIGFDGAGCTLTWQRGANGHWVNYAEGSAQCTFTLTEENLSWDWQLIAQIPS